MCLIWTKIRSGHKAKHFCWCEQTSAVRGLMRVNGRQARSPEILGNQKGMPAPRHLEISDTLKDHRANG